MIEVEEGEALRFRGSVGRTAEVVRAKWCIWLCGSIRRKSRIISEEQPISESLAAVDQAPHVSTPGRILKQNIADLCSLSSFS